MTAKAPNPIDTAISLFMYNARRDSMIVPDTDGRDAVVILCSANGLLAAYRITLDGRLVQMSPDEARQVYAFHGGG